MGKIKTILRTGVKPYVEGRRNHMYTKVEIEVLAEERKDICTGCPHFQEEPIPFLRVKDTKIPELSDKMCGACGCSLPYKLRQSLEPCDKWEN